MRPSSKKALRTGSSSMFCKVQWVQTKARRGCHSPLLAGKERENPPPAQAPRKKPQPRNSTGALPLSDETGNDRKRGRVCSLRARSAPFARLDRAKRLVAEFASPFSPSASAHSTAFSVIVGLARAAPARGSHAPGQVVILSMQQSSGLLHSRARGAGAGRHREAMSGASRRSRRIPRGANRRRPAAAARDPSARSARSG